MHIVNNPLTGETGQHLWTVPQGSASADSCIQHRAELRYICDSYEPVYMQTYLHA